MAADQKTIEGARDKWQDELKNVWGGAGHVVHSTGKVLQDAALGLTAIPVVGELLAEVDIPAYALGTVMKAAVRNSAETQAVKKAGGTEKDNEGRFLGHLAKSAVPVFDV
ncbi:MAG TPA: hypothetical protein VL625_07035 [Patescibacteria group bacterium]|jgi:hypothetical protein|nr:hypothetical protein [Patescibacteria group bacterium]